MNTSGHEESIKNIFFRIELCLLFSAGHSTAVNHKAHQQSEDEVPGDGACRHWGRPPDTEP